MEDTQRTVERVARESYGRLLAFLSAGTRDIAGAAGVSPPDGTGDLALAIVVGGLVGRLAADPAALGGAGQRVVTRRTRRRAGRGRVA